MKKSIVVLLGCLCLLLCSSGVGLKKSVKHAGVYVTPENLRLFVDQKTDPYTIKVGYTLNVPPDYIHSCARLIFKPYFLAVGNRYDLTPLVISGRRYLREEKRLRELTGKTGAYPDAMHLTSDGDGMKIKLSQVVPFQVWMAQSKLRADVILEACDHRKDVCVLTLADGVIWFPQGPGPALVKYVKEKAEVQKVAEYSFYFPVGKSVFERDYDGNAIAMPEMMELMDSLRDNPDMKLQKIIITGYSSPDGNPKFNRQLAEKRALEMKQRFTQRRNLNPRMIEIQTITEDWEGLRQLVEKNAAFPDRNAVLKILDGNDTDTQRLVLLQKLPQYKYIRQNVFPKLQKVTCRFYYTQKEEVTRIEPL